MTAVLKSILSLSKGLQREQLPFQPRSNQQFGPISSVHRYRPACVFANPISQSNGPSKLELHAILSQDHAQREGRSRTPCTSWSIPESKAIVNGVDLGPVGPTPEQAALGDFMIPQRGIFAIGRAFFDNFDEAKHSDATTQPADA